MGATGYGVWLGLAGVAVGTVLAVLAVLAARRFAVRIRHESALLEAARRETDRERDRAHQQALQFRRALDAMVDGIMLLDADNRLVEWNARFATLIGIPPNLLRVGTPMAEMLRAQAIGGEFGPMNSPAEIEAAVAERMANLDSFHGPEFIERIRPNGMAIEVRRTALPGGGFITLYTDITLRRQAEAAGRAAVAAAAEAVRQRQQFVAMVTHELRAPLGAIIHALALIDVGALSPEDRGFIATARGQAGQLRDLTADILDMSRLEEGRIVLRDADFSMPALMAEVCAQFRAQAEARGMMLVTELDPALPAAQSGDAGRIRQVLTNFVSNAVKYAEPGTVRLRAAVEGETLRLTVADPGPAIPPGQASVLFQPFSRLRAAELGGEGGTGLGLAISARLVALLGGDIGLAQEEGGNAFWFTLPIRPARGEWTASPEGAAVRPVVRAHVLLVEDLAPARDLTAILLRREGHRVDVAGDGLSAVEMAARSPYDVILLDIHLPGINGIVAAQRIRALPGAAGKAALVALSGMLSEETEAAAMTVMDALLAKPVQPEALLDTIARLAGGAAPRAPRPPRPPDRLDAARIASLRDSLPPGMFSRLLRQCLAEIHARMPGLTTQAANPPALREVAHALAGMAGSYGLAEFERAMRDIITAIDGGDAATANRIAATAEALLDEAEAAVLAEP